MREPFRTQIFKADYYLESGEQMSGLILVKDSGCVSRNNRLMAFVEENSEPIGFIRQSRTKLDYTLRNSTLENLWAYSTGKICIDDQFKDLRRHWLDFDRENLPLVNHKNTALVVFGEDSELFDIIEPHADFVIEATSAPKVVNFLARPFKSKAKFTELIRVSEYDHDKNVLNRLQFFYPLIYGYIRANGTEGYDGDVLLKAECIVSSGAIKGTNVFEINMINGDRHKFRGTAIDIARIRQELGVCLHQSLRNKRKTG